MKRIEFIAPVEAMRGNLSGNQELQYKTADGKVYSAAEFESLMADYKTRYVGAKRRQYGNKVLNIFSVKTKTTSTVTPKSKKAMAVFGGAAEVYRVAFKTLSIISNLQLAYRAWIEAGHEGSMRKWAFPIISAALDAKAAVIVFAAGATTVRVNNPWVSGGAGTPIEISQDILVKFWGELTTDGFNFRVGDLLGIARTGDTWESLADATYNVLGVEIFGDDNNVLIGPGYVQSRNKLSAGAVYEYVSASATIQPIGGNLEYQLTNVAPA